MRVVLQTGVPFRVLFNESAAPFGGPKQGTAARVAYQTGFRVKMFSVSGLWF